MYLRCSFPILTLPVAYVSQLVEKTVSAARARGDQRVVRLLGREDDWMEREEAMWAQESSRVARL
jgi:hypothetical protein